MTEFDDELKRVFKATSATSKPKFTEPKPVDKSTEAIYKPGERVRIKYTNSDDWANAFIVWFKPKEGLISVQYADGDRKGLWNAEQKLVNLNVEKGWGKKAKKKESLGHTRYMK